MIFELAALIIHHRLDQLGGSNNIDKTDFESCLRQSPLFTDEATTAVSFITQIEEVAPLRAICSLNITPLRRQSPRAVKVKQERRVFERQGKRTNIVKRVEKPIDSSMSPDKTSSIVRLKSAPATLDRRLPTFTFRLSIEHSSRRRDKGRNHMDLLIRLD